MANKTIKEIADELGVSKQAIFNRINDPALELDDYISLEGKAKVVSPEGIKILLDTFPEQKASSNSNSTANATVHVAAALDNSILEFLKSTIDLLQEQLSRKDIQIAEKDEQIKLLQDRLSESFQLSMQSQQLMAAVQTKAIESSEKPRGIFRKLLGE